MIVQIVEGVTAEIVLGKILNDMPAWDLGSIKVGPYVNGLEHEHHYLATIGSGNWYWSPNEFRFNKSDLLLSSVGVYTGSINLLPNDSVFPSQETIEGLLRLENAVGFRADMEVESWFEPNGKFLVTLVDQTLLESSDLIHLKVAPDFELLFHNNVLCGWALHDCCCYLTHTWQVDGKIEPDAAFIGLLIEYIQLTPHENFWKMLDGDSIFLQPLLDLKATVEKQGQGKLYSILVPKIEYILSFYYGIDE